DPDEREDAAWRDRRLAEVPAQPGPRRGESTRACLSRRRGGTAPERATDCRDGGRRPLLGAEAAPAPDPSAADGHDRVVRERRRGAAEEGLPQPPAPEAVRDDQAGRKAR